MAIFHEMQYTYQPMIDARDAYLRVLKDGSDYATSALYQRNNQLGRSSAYELDLGIDLIRLFNEFDADGIIAMFGPEYAAFGRVTNVPVAAQSETGVSAHRVCARHFQDVEAQKVSTLMRMTSSPVPVAAELPQRSSMSENSLDVPPAYSHAAPPAYSVRAPARRVEAANVPPPEYTPPAVPAVPAAPATRRT